MTLVNGSTAAVAALPPLQRPIMGGNSPQGPRALPPLRGGPATANAARSDVGVSGIALGAVRLAPLPHVAAGVTLAVSEAEEEAARRASMAEVVTTPVEEQEEEEDSPCAKCGNPSEFACARCNQQFYCSAVCQRADWSEHRVQCNKGRRRSSSKDTAAAAAAVAVAVSASQPAPITASTVAVDTPSQEAAHVATHPQPVPTEVTPKSVVDGQLLDGVTMGESAVDGQEVTDVTVESTVVDGQVVADAYAGETLADNSVVAEAENVEATASALEEADFTPREDATLDV
jgi:hypothetical protein